MTTLSEGAGASQTEWLPVQLGEDFAPVTADMLRNAEELACLIKLKNDLGALEPDSSGTFEISPLEIAMAATRATTTWLRRHRHPFRFVEVKTPELAAEIGAALEASEPDGDWPVRKWTINSQKRGANVLAVMVPGTDRYGGMAAFKRNVTVDDDLEGGLSIEYQYDGDYLFVVPDARRNRLSSALRLCIAIMFADDFERLADLIRTGEMEKFGNPKIKFYMKAEAYSDEGLRFLDMVGDDMEYAAYSAFEGVNGARVNMTVDRDYGL